jgi:hypothetical protein
LPEIETVSIALPDFVGRLDRQDLRRGQHEADRAFDDLVALPSGCPAEAGRPHDVHHRAVLGVGRGADGETVCFGTAWR